MSRRFLNMLYDEEKLGRLLEQQQRLQWDMEASIPWTETVDTEKFLVALDEQAFFFPSSSAEERLAISQMMGLIIASSIYEMEECLIRLKQEAWIQVRDNHPVGPEFDMLGEQFFLEEEKHSACFKRYVEVFAHSVGVEVDDLLGILPRVEGGRSEAFLRAHLKLGGHSFWWVVAIVEQVFLDIYTGIKPFEDEIEPLYYCIHRRHFEEEARHAPFPYLLIELISDQRRHPLRQLWDKVDLGIGQVVQGLWALHSLGKLKGVTRFQGKHQFFDTLAKIVPKLEARPFHSTLWKLFIRAPYVGPMVNPVGQDKILKFAKKRGTLTIPFPSLNIDKLVGY